MEVDRYTKFVLTIIALALSTLAFQDIVAPQPAIAGMGQFPSSILINHSGIPPFPSTMSLSLLHTGHMRTGDAPAPEPSPDGQ